MSNFPQLSICMYIIMMVYNLNKDYLRVAISNDAKKVPFTPNLEDLWSEDKIVHEGRLCVRQDCTHIENQLNYQILRKKKKLHLYILKHLINRIKITQRIAPRRELG